MKKSIFILAAVAIVASCSDQDTLKKDLQNDNGMAISFTTFTENLTRGNVENSDTTYKWVFFTHHDDFQVWGYKNTSSNAVFDADSVSVTVNPSDASKYDYTYSPLRFWDKAATKYEFYAAAPKDNAGWTFVEPTNENQKNGYFETSSTLTPSNLAATPADSYAESFKGVTDVDKMIAEPASVAYASFNRPVQLNFIHILSRLNVTIKKADNLATQIVKLKKFEVKNLNGSGNFSESTAATQSGNNNRWSGQGTPITYSATTSSDTAALFKIQQTPYYIIESLVIPQDAAIENIALDGKAKNVESVNYVAIESAEEPYFVITYVIWDGTEGHDAEEFTAYYNLATVFTAAAPTTLKFNEGWQNTLNITLQPNQIEFCAEVAAWADRDRAGQNDPAGVEKTIE